MKLDVLSFRPWTCVALFVLPCAVVLTGCGRKEMYHVRGKVTYKDGSIPTGAVAVVNFSPTGEATTLVRKGASGSIEPDGTFEMVTRMPGDGVHPGEYGVTFRVLRDVTGPMTSLVDPKYSAPTSPVYTVKVDRDISDLSYEIEKAKGVSPAAPSTIPAGPGS